MTPYMLKKWNKLYEYPNFKREIIENCNIHEFKCKIQSSTQLYII